MNQQRTKNKEQRTGCRTASKRYVPKTKIVCTIGPASSREGVLRKMMQAGMDIARVNFSHGNHAGHAGKIETIRSLNRRYRRRIRLLGDLAGPRVRMGYFCNHEPVLLEKGRKVVLCREGAGCLPELPCDYPGDYRDFAGAEHLYLDDGNLILKVLRLGESRVETRVVLGGWLRERKAVNFPGARLRFPRVSEKDRRDLEFIVGAKLDYIALSFVRDHLDVEAVRELVGSRHPKVKIIAKIENRDGVENLDRILDVADGIMVARGDMGVCLPIWEVPLLQKHIIRKCNLHKKLVITATQMLEHMVDHRIPTRAEVTDVANAVLDGTSAVMLSAETAVGKYPVEAVAMMNQIIKHTEQHGGK